MCGGGGDLLIQTISLNHILRMSEMPALGVSWLWTLNSTAAAHLFATHGAASGGRPRTLMACDLLVYGVRYMYVVW